MKYSKYFISLINTTTACLAGYEMTFDTIKWTTTTTRHDSCVDGYRKSNKMKPRVDIPCVIVPSGAKLATSWSNSTSRYTESCATNKEEKLNAENFLRKYSLRVGYTTLQC